MNQRSTFGEIRWPMDDDSLEQARDWAGNIAERALDWTWRAFDQLQANHVSQIDFRQPLDQIERDLTSKHFICINSLWAQETRGESSIVPHHEFPELDSRPPASGKPPAYDLAFVWYENQRVAWPIEAKVVKTSNALSGYMHDVDKFCNGIATPFVGQGGLIAYLLSGRPLDFFSKLSARLGVPLNAWPAQAHRPHRISYHDRASAPRLCLHHLVMQLSISSRTARKRNLKPTSTPMRRRKSHADPGSMKRMDPVDS